MKKFYLGAATMVLVPFLLIWTSGPTPTPAWADFTWKGLTWNRNAQDVHQVFGKVGGDTAYFDVYQNLSAAYVVEVDEASAVSAGLHTYTISDIADYSYLDFLFPGPSYLESTRVPKAALTGPYDQTLYALQQDGDLFTVNASNASIGTVGDLSDDNDWFDIAYFNGFFYAIRVNSQFYSVDWSDASITTSFGLLTGPNGFFALSAHDGVLYTARSNGELYSIAVSGGSASLTLVGDLGTGSSWVDLAPHDGTLYALESDGDLYSVDVSDASTTSVGDLSSDTNWRSLAPHDGTLYALQQDGDLYSVDASNASITSVGDLSSDTNWTGLATVIDLPALANQVAVELDGTTLTLCVQYALDWFEVHGIK